MPRKKHGADEKTRPVGGNLTEQLAAELRGGREWGQPTIHEEEFPTGLIRATVIWDEWDHLSHEDRTAVILQAYERAEGAAYRDLVTLASGLTVPEAYGVGMLPYQVLPALRKGDPVTADDCRRAMVEMGASTLVAPDQPQLRFLLEEEAEAAVKELGRRLPGSEPVWHVHREVGRVEDWATA